MPTNVWNASWLAQNRERNYPLAEDATRKDTSGAFTLPTDFIVELCLPVDVGMLPDPTQFFLKNLAVFATGYTITIGYQPASGPAIDAAVAQISASGFSANKTFRLLGVGDFDESKGWVTIGSLDRIREQPGGAFTFVLSGGRLEPDAIKPDIQGVSSLRVQNGQNISRRVTGDAVFVSGTNFRIDLSGQSFVFNAIQGEGLQSNCDCEEPIGQPILTINGQGPGPDGDFALQAGDCMASQAITNGMLIKNTCAVPCCGCPEMKEVAAKLLPLSGEISTMKGLAARLDGSVSTAQSYILGSRLGSRACTPP